MMRFLALCAVVATLPSCSSLDCGEGTYLMGDVCQPFDPNDKTPPVVTVTPPGGRSRDALPSSIMLETDEPARIYYTTDGSDPDVTMGMGERDPVTVVDIVQGMTLKYVAVDATGNASQLETTVFENDLLGPPPVTGMTVQINGTTATINWTNPSGGDYAGTVVARVADVVDVAPAGGTTLTGASMLSNSVQVLAVGTGTSFTDPGRPPGPVRYVAWTYDDLGNYGRSVVVGSEIALGSLTGKITYVVDTDTFSVAQSPANIDLTGTMHNLNGTTLTISLSAKNTSAKFLQNPKVELTTVTNATFSNSDGTADTFPFRTLGPNSLAPGVTVTRDLVFTNVNPGTTVTLDLAFATHPSLTWAYRYYAPQVIDLGSGTLLPQLTTIARGPNDRNNRGRTQLPLFLGGRYLDVPTSHGVVERFDLVTRTSVKTGQILVGEKAVLQSLTQVGAEMIAVLKLAGRRDSGLIQIARLDEALKVTARINLPFTDAQGGGFPTITPDGTALAITVNGGIVMIDLATTTVIDPIPSTPLIEIIPHGLTDAARQVVFFNGGNAMLVVGRSSGEYAVLKKSGGTWSKTRYQDSVTGARVYNAQMMSDGKIWIAMSSGLRVFDPANDSAPLTTLANYPYLPQGVSVTGGSIFIARQTKTEIDEVSLAGDVLRTFNLPAAQGVYHHWMSVTSN